MLTDIGTAINRYFAWMAAGPRWRFVLGIGGPLLALFLLVQLVSGGGDEPSSLASTSPTTTAATRPAGTQQASTTAAQASVTTPPGSAAASTTGTPRASTTPQATVQPGGTYVVKSGDTLGAICTANVPSMSINACVDAIVQLNKLTSAASLQIGQSLTLPGGAATSTTPGAGSTPAASPTTASSPVASTTTPAATTSTPPR